MRSRPCQTVHNPPYSHGDCIRACISTLIDRDDVPHVFDGRKPEESWVELRKYLATKGKFLALFAVTDPYDDMADNNPNIPYMLLCKVSSGCDHAVVCKNGTVVNDPAWNKLEIIGEHSVGFWIAGIIGELSK